MGLPEAAEDRDLLALVFHPGFSTARALTSVSGRGVGLDVVKSQVNALHGTVGLESIAGVGTTFALTVPLTVTLIRALLVESAGRTFALATTQVIGLRRLFLGSRFGDARRARGSVRRGRVTGVVHGGGD